MTAEELIKTGKLDDALDNAQAAVRNAPAEGQVPAALELRNKAFEAAPATAGKLNDQPFEWIADADSRLGPMLDAIIDGYIIGFRSVG